jgi:hypothetical protein
MTGQAEIVVAGKQEGSVIILRDAMWCYDTIGYFMICNVM